MRTAVENCLLKTALRRLGAFCQYKPFGMCNEVLGILFACNDLRRAGLMGAKTWDDIYHISETAQALHRRGDAI